MKGPFVDQIQGRGLKGGFALLKRAVTDIVRTPRWVVIVLVLGLVTCIPIFGAIVMYGYLLRWAREAAWRIESPLRPRVFDNSDGVLYAFGWRAFCLAFLFGLIPGMVSATLLSMQMGAQMASGSLAGSAFGSTSVDVSGVSLGLSGEIAVFIVGALVTPIIWVSIMRMALYRDAGAGLQLGKIFQMIGRDALGLVPVWLLHCVLNELFSIAALGLQETLLSMMTSGDSMLLGFSLFSLAATYVLQVLSVLLTMLSLRAVGLWTAQFEVAQWGPKEAPLPPRGGYRG